MKKLVILLLLMSTFAAYAQDKNDDATNIAVGAGLSVSGAVYKGEDISYSLFPYVELESKYVFWAGFQGGVHLYKSNNLKLDLAAAYIANKFKPKDNDYSYMKQLDRRKPSVGAGLALSYKALFGIIDASVIFDILGVNHGFTASASYSLPYMLTEQTLIYASIGAEYGSEDYNDYYYGVSRNEALKSGLNQYEADGGIVVSLDIGLMHDFSEDIHSMLLCRYSFLPDDIKDSPMVDASGVWAVTAALYYSF